jgi:phage-related protein
MKGKFLFVVGLGVGYVLGTRAGRERYEQIRRAAQSVWNQPVVQEGVDTVKTFAMSRVGDLGDTVLDGAKQFVRKVSSTQDTAKNDVSRAATSAKAAVDDAAEAVDESIDAAAKTAKSAAESAATAARSAKSASTSATKPAARRGATPSTDS